MRGGGSRRMSLAIGHPPAVSFAILGSSGKESAAVPAVAEKTSRFGLVCQEGFRDESHVPSVLELLRSGALLSCAALRQRLRRSGLHAVAGSPDRLDGLLRGSCDRCDFGGHADRSCAVCFAALEALRPERRRVPHPRHERRSCLGSGRQLHRHRCCWGEHGSDGDGSDQAGGQEPGDRPTHGLERCRPHPDCLLHDLQGRPGLPGGCGGSVGRAGAVLDAAQRLGDVQHRQRVGAGRQHRLA
jgi:hypothetical protein